MRAESSALAGGCASRRWFRAIIGSMLRILGLVLLALASPPSAEMVDGNPIVIIDGDTVRCPSYGHTELPRGASS